MQVSEAQNTLADQLVDPGAVVLSSEANEQGPKLVNILGEMPERFGVPLDRRKLHARPTVRGRAPELSVLQSLQLSQDEAIGCVSESGPGFVGASHAAAIATGATRERPGTALALTLEGCCASIRLRRACSTMKHA